MHIFPYSKRPGTPAANMPDQVPNAVKEERAHRAAQIAAGMEQFYLEQFVGQTLPVLFEQERDGLWHGYTTRYSEVTAAHADNLHNQLRDVHITAVERNCLRGNF